MIFKIQQESDNQFVLKNEQIKSLMRRCQNNKMRAILFFWKKKNENIFKKSKVSDWMMQVRFKMDFDKFSKNWVINFFK